jgi:subtilisin-like proprotein convertase family protein
MNSSCLFTSLCLILPVVGANATAEEISISFNQVTAIPDTSGSSSVLVELEVPVSDLVRTVTDVRVSLKLDHPWVGDLSAKLESPGGASAMLFDRTGLVPVGFPGPFGCGGNDVDATFQDNATLSVDDVCSITVTPVLAGTLRPTQVLSGLNGIEPTGIWKLRLSDMQSGDVGVFRSVTLVVVVEPDCNGDGVPDECTCPADLNGDGTVGGPDLSIMLSSWGAGGSADLDGDGVVAGEDLARLLSTWGICD